MDSQKYELKQGDKPYIFQTSVDGNSILLTVETPLKKIVTRNLAVVDLQALDKFFKVCDSPSQGIALIDKVLKDHKVAVNEENQNITLIFFITDDDITNKIEIPFGNDRASLMRTNKEEILQNVRRSSLRNSNSNIPPIPVETNVVTNADINLTENADANININVTENVESNLDINTNINTEQISTENITTNYDTNPVILTNNINTIDTTTTTTTTSTATNFVKILPTKYLPTKVIESNEAIKTEQETTFTPPPTFETQTQTQSQEFTTTNTNYITKAPIYLPPKITSVQTTTDTVVENEVKNINQDWAQSPPTNNIFQEETNNNIFQEETNNNIYQEETNNNVFLEQTNNNIYQEETTNINEDFNQPLPVQTQAVQTKDEISELIVELKKLKDRELADLKNQVNLMRSMQLKKKEEDKLRQKEEENLLLRKQLEESEKYKRQYEEEIKSLRATMKSNEQNQNVGLESKNITFEEKAQQICVKGDILRSAQELEMLTRKINTNLISQNKKITLNLLYKATADSDKAFSFHDKCDGANRTLVLIETDKEKRFGGYTSKSWKGDCIEKKDDDAFVFSLDKMKTYDNTGELAIGCYPKFGPIFMGCQIRIYDNCFSKGGTTFEKGLNYKTEEDYELNGGERNFNVKEIEVYEVIIQ